MSQSGVSDLGQRTARGFGWTFASGIVQQAVQFALGVLIARQLDPSDFGLMGMLAIFLAVSRCLVDGGMAAALIQKRNATPSDATTVFFLNLVASLALAGILFSTSGLIARFYEQPLLQPMLQILCFGPVISATARVQQAMLTREMQFHLQFRVIVVSTLLGGIIGLAGAIGGLGVWSLVAMSLAQDTVRSIMLWWVNNWRPSGRISIESAREMTRYGIPLMGSAVVSALTDNLYSAVIGKAFTADKLGFFNRARSLQRLPVTSLTASVTKVSFPAFAEIQDDTVRLRSGVRRSVRLLAFVVFPMVAFIAGAAHSLIIVLLTEKWLPSVAYLQLLCYAEVLFPLHAINLNVLMARGETRLFFWMSLIKRSLSIGMLFFMCQFGIEAIIIGQIISSVVSYGINSFYSGRILKYGASRQLLDCIPFAAAATIMGLGVASLEMIPWNNRLFVLAIQAILALTGYGVLCLVFRVPEPREGWRLLKKRLGRRGGNRGTSMESSGSQADHDDRN